jgi:hypothetical protein
MSDEREKLQEVEDPELETEDVEAHQLGGPGQGQGLGQGQGVGYAGGPGQGQGVGRNDDDDVEAHRLY